MSIGTISTDDFINTEPLKPLLVELDFWDLGERVFIFDGLFGESPYHSPDDYTSDWLYLISKLSKYKLESIREKLIMRLQQRYGRWYYPSGIDIARVNGVYSVLIHGSELKDNHRLHKNYMEYTYNHEFQYVVKTVAESIRAMDELKKDVGTESKNGKLIIQYKAHEPVTQKVTAHTRRTSKLYKVLDFDDNELERSNDINELKSTFQKKYPYFKPKDIDPFIYEI